MIQNTSRPNYIFKHWFIIKVILIRKNPQIFSYPLFSIPITNIFRFNITLQIYDRKMYFHYFLMPCEVTAVLMRTKWLSFRGRLYESLRVIKLNHIALQRRGYGYLINDQPGEINLICLGDCLKKWLTWVHLFLWHFMSRLILFHTLVGFVKLMIFLKLISTKCKSV